MKTPSLSPVPAALTPVRVAANASRHLLAPIAALALMSVAHGADVSWTGGAGDGSLNTASNWSTGVLPTVNDTVTFGVTNGMLANNRVLLPSSTTYGSVVVDLDTFAIGLGNNPRVLSLGSESISSMFSFTTNFTNPGNNMTFYASDAENSLVTLQLRSDLTFSNAGSGTVIFGQKTQIQNSITSTGTDRVIFTGSGDFAFISIAGRSSTITNVSTSGASLNLVLDSGFSGTVDYASEVGPTVSSAEINGGTFLLNNANAVMNATNVSVGVSGTLGGIGTIASATTVSGTLLPGGLGSTGNLVFNESLTLLSGSTTTFDILAPSNFDLISSVAVGNTVTFAGGLNLSFANGYATEGSLQIFSFANYIGGFDQVNATGLADGYTALFDSSTGLVTVVPEPQASHLVFALLAAVVVFRVVRRKWPLRSDALCSGVRRSS